MSNKFNKFNKQDIEDIIPNSNKIKMETMSEDEKNGYISLYNFYRKLFTQYIVEKLEIKKYDDKIFKSGLNFKTLDEKDMDIYQYFSCELLKYFYIRNNIYLENLTNDEKVFLKDKFNARRLELDSELNEYIEKTYERAIFEDICGDNQAYNVIYGSDSRRYIASNNSLIIGFRYNEFEPGEVNEEEWQSQYEKQIFEYLPEVISEMKTEFEKKVKIPVEIMQYSEFSVRPRKDIKI